MKDLIRPAFSLFVMLTAVTGIVYPATVTGIAKVLFPAQAEGSLIVENGKPVGSRLIGQNFTDQKYIWGRPSATGPMPYNASASSGSNQGPLNPALKEAVKARIDALKASDQSQTAPIPEDLVTASGSGLDPQISPAAARWQAPRIARIRNLSEAEVNKLIDAHTEGRQFGLLGEPRVNVLALNLALDRLGKP